MLFKEIVLIAMVTKEKSVKYISLLPDPFGRYNPFLILSGCRMGQALSQTKVLKNDLVRNRFIRLHMNHIGTDTYFTWRNA
jgi:hypothetical protein